MISENVLVLAWTHWWLEETRGLDLISLNVIQLFLFLINFMGFDHQTSNCKISTSIHIAMFSPP